MEEHFFQCPYCWEQISMLIDVSQNQQTYIEDCEICCNPIQVSITISDQQIVSFQAENIEQ
ncbi:MULTISPECIES: CPXCG motif-containing cysteine-rich protein [Winogradskyella]|uniref:CPXCG motif-containing cysteine-rich protein n=1 Tax=Winogradskyella marincola TaxID=3037795 RepID=A0ABT6FXV0_9FLAO|nr:CPXCG motif-containing cysteine-rich protein [Winogradskyella sp. YYF002]MDG4714622.1 CPXCG motif-containing cysteine-rich protein [Winogradskyella sp. YYF002]